MTGGPPGVAGGAGTEVVEREDEVGAWPLVP